MTPKEAYAILGEPLAHYELVGLVKALLHPSRPSTPRDYERLAAAMWALRHRDAWSRECLWNQRNPPRTLWTPDQLKAFAL
jgi:hypothetical protein